MADIKLLSEEVISKIAAGEVIERPASVLKELIENSIDAGAKTLRIDIDKAGRALIRVNDDGKGMSAGDIKMAVLRHATSKIERFEDLDTLQTFGFRGEALYSVGAVSKLEITSCIAGADTGSRLIINGGKIVSLSESAPVIGTIVEVKDLFFNVPARSKFLKSDYSERSHLLRTAEESALSNFNAAFYVDCDGREVYSFPAAAQGFKEAVLERAKIIFGKEVCEGMAYGEVSPAVRAFVSRPDNLAASRTLQFFFVNRRPVASRALQQALYKAYETRPKDRHPACIVYIDIPPSDFDVNIHPQKKDVRFKNESEIYSLVLRTLAGAIGAGRREQGQTAACISEQEAAFGKQAEYGASGSGGEFFPVASEHVEPLDEELKFPTYENAPSWWMPPYYFLGQVEKSFLVFESCGGMLVIDQHAAQERIIFEEYLNALAENKVSSQKLMLPMAIEVSASALENIISQ
ncbi:MAG: DNA mismatch repair endonuclease MutL, partial [Elusimicrobia bacterium]|nr:DNA mismatch repair endonuclease MutL [Elusimicrobiota bacterium]